MKDTTSAFITVHTYAEFATYIEAFAKGRIPLLLIIGEPGVSKSKSVKAAVSKLKHEPTWLEGQLSAIALYCALYENRNKRIIIDDVDSLYANDATRRLLKCVCQTDAEKSVSWNTRNPYLDEAGIPRQFTTTSTVCIIANEWKTLSTDVAAIEDRAVAMLFKPTAAEVHLQTAKWFDDQAAFDFIGSIVHLIENPSMRHYIFARNLRVAGMKDWQQRTIERVCSGDVLRMTTIKSLDLPEKTRIKEWIKRKFGSRATYFRVAKKIPKPVDMPQVKVKGPLKTKARKPPKAKRVKRPAVSKSHVPPKEELQLRVVS